MKVSFIHSTYENLGVGYLSSYLRKSGHHTSLCFSPELFNSFQITNKSLHKAFDCSEELINGVFDYNPGLICMSVTSADYSWACSIAKRIKDKRDIPVIFGGFHPSSVPERVIKEDFVDFVCVGEGEEALLEVADAIEQGKTTKDIPNIWSKENGKTIANPPRRLVSDLDSLPFPDKDLFYNEYKGFSSIYTIFSGRGCPFVCTYCYNSLFRRIYKDKGPYLRRRSVDNVIDELMLAKNKYGIKKVYFLDDIFIHDINWLREFSKKYRVSINLPFFCEAYPAYVNEEVVTLLKSAGCQTIDMGIQTISEDLRRRYLRREDSNEQIKTAIQLFRKEKIFTHLDIMFGFPGQGEEEALDIARFFNKHKPSLMSVFWLRYYPKIDIVEIAKEEGLITDQDIENIEEGKEASLFLIGYGISYNKNLAKIANLIFISYLIPSNLFNFIINYKLYRYFPAYTILYQKILSLPITFYSEIFKRTKRLTYFSYSIVIKYYCFFIMRKLGILDIKRSF